MNCSENMKPEPKPDPPKVDVGTVLKYVFLTLWGIMMFKAAAIQARFDRGYSAIGGEVFFLFLPVFYYLISKTVRDWLDDLRNNKPKRRNHK